MSRARATAALLPAILGLAAFAGTARADWGTGEVPEGSNAFTIGRHQLRLNLIGTSAFGLTHDVELSTYLVLDALLFPNFALKVRVADDGTLALALSGGVGAGLYPYAGGAVIPYPPVGGGAIGVVAASLQHLGAQLSLRVGSSVTLTARGNLVAVEAGTLGGAAAVGPGAAAALPFAGGGSAVGATAGVEGDLVLGPEDAVIVEADAVGFRGADAGLALAWAGYTHAWEHFHLTVGAYTVVDLPDATMLHDKLPVAPFANAYWTFR